MGHYWLIVRRCLFVFGKLSIGILKTLIFFAQSKKQQQHNNNSKTYYTSLDWVPSRGKPSFRSADQIRLAEQYSSYRFNLGSALKGTRSDYTGSSEPLLFSHQEQIYFFSGGGSIFFCLVWERYYMFHLYYDWKNMGFSGLVSTHPRAVNTQLTALANKRHDDRKSEAVMTHCGHWDIANLFAVSRASLRLQNRFPDELSS